jgi:hypothetical protein
MNRQTSVAMPEIKPTVDIENVYRQLKHLRKMVKQVEGLDKKPATRSNFLGMRSSLIVRRARYSRLVFRQPQADPSNRRVDEKCDRDGGSRS